MREMILLGAGASVTAGVPAAFKMTDQIVQQFQADPLRQPHARVLAFVIGGLLFQAGIRGTNPLQSGVNVEELFNAVQLLAGRHTLEAAPFVGSWHAMVEEFDKIHPFTASTQRLNRILFDGVTKEVLKAFSTSPPSFKSDAVDRALEKTLRQAMQDFAKKGSFTLSTSQGVGKAVENYQGEVVKNGWKT